MAVQGENNGTTQSYMANRFKQTDFGNMLQKQRHNQIVNSRNNTVDTDINFNYFCKVNQQILLLELSIINGSRQQTWSDNAFYSEELWCCLLPKAATKE